MYRSLAIILALACAAPAFAELQNVQAGGSLRIRGSYYTSPGLGDSLNGRNPYFQSRLVSSYGWAGGNPLSGVRWPGQPGRLRVSSLFDWDESGNGWSWVEQRTRVNVKADFTDNVAAFIELESYDNWGEDFRSNYLTGVDARAVSADDVEVYQAYIEARDLFGTPITAKIGRQEFKLGSGWLIAPTDAAAFFPGLSFDAIRLTYATDQISLDAFWAKLAENSPAEQDGDVDLYGLYASYLGIKNVTLDAYWLFLRDAVSLRDTAYGVVGEALEDWAGVDNYDATALHTAGLRGNGAAGAFDFEAELAYQFGEADAVGATFAGAGWASPYGPPDARFDAWGGNLEVGYTFDVKYSPRVYLGAAYFGGEDHRDLDFGQWLGALACPFWNASPSVSFNRLFSQWEYSEFLENSDLSNAWVGRAGVSVKPTETIKLLFTLSHFEALDAFGAPWPYRRPFGSRWFAPLAFLARENSKDMGWEVGLYGTYQYSGDLSFDVGWARLFVGDGLAQGNYSAWNGLMFNGGTGNDDADYVFFETKLAF